MAIRHLHKNGIGKKNEYIVSGYATKTLKNCESTPAPVKQAIREASDT